MAVLVAIAIPVFTAQLEKSREATDAANIRAAYAEVMVDAIDNGASSHSKTIDLKQQDENWQNAALLDGLVTVFNSQSNASSVLKTVSATKHTAVLTWNPGSGTGSNVQEGYISIAIN